MTIHGANTLKLSTYYAFDSFKMCVHSKRFEFMFNIDFWRIKSNNGYRPQRWQTHNGRFVHSDKWFINNKFGNKYILRIICFIWVYWSPSIRWRSVPLFINFLHTESIRWVRQMTMNAQNNCTRTHTYTRYHKITRVTRTCRRCEQSLWPGEELQICRRHLQLVTLL